MKVAIDMKMPEGEQLHEDPRGDLQCPFCAGKIHFPINDSKEHTAVFHTIPPCPTYLDATDALEFVKACNVEVARRRGVGLA